MTEEATGKELTPEQLASQEIENKNQNQEHAAKRLAEKNQALELELKAYKEGKVPQKKEENANTGTPDIAELVRKELGAIKETDSKVSELLTEFPELKEYEAKIRQYISDDSRKNIPVEDTIAGAVGVKGLMMIGSKINSERLQSAKETGVGGGGAQIETQSEESKAESKWLNSLPDGFK